MSADQIVEAVRSLAGSPAALHDMSEKAAAICDGRGALKTLAYIEAMVGGDITVRAATMDDVDLVYAWQSHPRTRAYFKNPEVPVYEDHIAWMREKISSADHEVFMIEGEGGRAWVHSSGMPR